MFRFSRSYHFLFSYHYVFRLIKIVKTTLSIFSHHKQNKPMPLKQLGQNVSANIISQTGKKCRHKSDNYIDFFVTNNFSLLKIQQQIDDSFVIRYVLRSSI